MDLHDLLTYKINLPRHSVAPLVDPGKLIINEFFLVPAAGRLKAAWGVILSDSVSIDTSKPGASRSRTALVASGVTSRGAKPVPPKK